MKTIHSGPKIYGWKCGSLAQHIHNINNMEAPPPSSSPGSLYINISAKILSAANEHQVRRQGDCLGSAKCLPTAESALKRGKGGGGGGGYSICSTWFCIFHGVGLFIINMIARWADEQIKQHKKSWGGGAIAQLPPPPRPWGRACLASITTGRIELMWW